LYRSSDFSAADFGWRVNHVKPWIPSCLNKTNKKKNRFEMDFRTPPPSNTHTQTHTLGCATVISHIIPFHIKTHCSAVLPATLMSPSNIALGSWSLCNAVKLILAYCHWSDSLNLDSNLPIDGLTKDHWRGPVISRISAFMCWPDDVFTNPKGKAL